MRCISDARLHKRGMLVKYRGSIYLVRLHVYGGEHSVVIRTRKGDVFNIHKLDEQAARLSNYGEYNKGFYPDVPADPQFTKLRVTWNMRTRSYEAPAAWGVGWFNNAAYRNGFHYIWFAEGENFFKLSGYGNNNRNFLTASAASNPRRVADDEQYTLKLRLSMYKDWYEQRMGLPIIYVSNQGDKIEHRFDSFHHRFSNEDIFSDKLVELYHAHALISPQTIDLFGRAAVSEVKSSDGATTFVSTTEGVFQYDNEA